jgi:hypothetical protein
MVVPHYFQTSEQTCGAACLRMLFAALGTTHDEAIIAQHCGMSPGPMFQWHFVVPLSLAQGEVTFHDPADGPDRRAQLDDFLASWATAGYRGVRVWTP